MPRPLLWSTSSSVKRPRAAGRKCQGPGFLSVKAPSGRHFGSGENRHDPRPYCPSRSGFVGPVSSVSTVVLIVPAPSAPPLERPEVANKAGNDVGLRIFSFSEVEIIKLPAGKAPEAKDEQPEKRSELPEEKTSEPQDLTVTCTSAFELSKTSQSDRHYPNSKVISISVEQCQTNHSSVNSIPCKEEDGEKVKKPKQITNRKRSTKSTDSDESYKANGKKSKFLEFDQYNDERERTVSEYVEKASGSSLEELQRNTEKLQQEIHSLSALARTKELEWNDIIRLKKLKEEMYLRLIRRKQVMLLSMGATGRVPDISNWDFASENRMSEFFTNDEVSYNPVTPSVSPKPPPRIPSNLTITKSQSSTSQNLQRFLMQPQNTAEAAKPAASLMMVPIVSSTPLSIASSSYLQRPQLATPLKIPIPDREKLKGARTAPIPILPKPNQPTNEHSPPIGRQGPIVDVKSIIADYRQNHPEQIPRRGRRLKGQPGPAQVQTIPENIVTSSRGVLSMSSLALGSGSQVRTVGSTSGTDVSYLVGGIAQNGQETSRPSSADSNRSSSNATNDLAASGVSFKDVLVQFAKMSQHQQNDRRNATPPTKTQAPSKSALYPEVTLHPVLPPGSNSPPNPSSSLLHGILTKSTSGRAADGQSNSRNTAFSPTLARLLTTPDRSSMSTTITTALRGSGTSTTSTRGLAGPVSITDLLSTSKVSPPPPRPPPVPPPSPVINSCVFLVKFQNRNELTITPVVSTLQPAKMKEEMASVSVSTPRPLSPSPKPPPPRRQSMK